MLGDVVREAFGPRVLGFGGSLSSPIDHQIPSGVTERALDVANDLDATQERPFGDAVGVENHSDARTGHGLGVEPPGLTCLLIQETSPADYANAEAL